MEIDKKAYEKFDNSKIELVHGIRKFHNVGACAIKSALVMTNYDIQKATELLFENKYTIT